MIFNVKSWQKRARNIISRSNVHSYGKIATTLKMSKSTFWNIINNEQAVVTVANFLLISRILEINPLDYIVVDEVQLKLL